MRRLGQAPAAPTAVRPAIRRLGAPLAPAPETLDHPATVPEPEAPAPPEEPGWYWVRATLPGLIVPALMPAYRSPAGLAQLHNGWGMSFDDPRIEWLEPIPPPGGNVQ